MRSNNISYSLLLAMCVSTFGLSGCGSGDGDSARFAQTVDASKNGVTSIQIETNDGSVHVKASYQFNLIGEDAEGKKTNLNNKATWKLSDPSLGSIKNGLFKPSGKIGELYFTASYAGMDKSQTILLNNSNLVRVTVEHESNATSVDECQNTRFVAKAEFADGKTLPYNITWKIVSGAELGSFKDATKGVLSTVNSGTIGLVATGLDNNNTEVPSSQFDITVNDQLSTITVTTTPAATELRDGETATVKVTGVYTDPANPIDITDNATISASPSDLLLVEGTKITARNGLPNGKVVSLKGTCGGKEGTKDITIKERRLRSVEIKNSNGGTSNLSMSEGSKLDLNLTATYIDNSTKDDYTNNVVWEIDDRNNTITDDSKVTISSSGELNVNTDLNLTASAIIYVTAEVRDDSGNVILNPNGERVEDEINITINPN